MEINIGLPWPPSTNHYWRHGIVAGKPRIFLGKKGKDFRAEVLRQCQIMRIGGLRLTGRLAVTLTLSPPTRAKCDLANYEKSTIDALQVAKVYVDDSQIDDLRLIRGPVVKGGRVDVKISVIPPTP
ncbi:MAG: RusA family crossover junction endodeoxyribonuclease [Nitrospirota bacterium]|nr:RusA family crossover junction endodeoxyribonuclease [Nitrospirota bacterium]